MKNTNEGWVKWATLAAVAVAIIVAWPAFKSCSGNVTDTAKNALDNAGELASNAASQVGDATNSAVKMAEDATDKAVDMAGNAANAVKDTAGNAVNATGDIAGNAASTLKEGAANLANTIKKSADFFKFEEGSTSAKFANFLSSNKDVDSTTFVLDQVNFNTGTANLADNSKQQLQNIAKIVKEYDGVKFELQGYTDNTGSRAANEAVSKARAIAVKDYLVSLGVDASRLDAVGYGPENARGDNSTMAGRQENRRTEIKAYKM